MPAANPEDRLHSTIWAATAAALVLALASKSSGEEVQFFDTKIAPSGFEKSLKTEPFGKKEKKSEKKKPERPAPRVEQLGDPQRIEFRGVEAFDVDALRRGLANDLAYQAAARPSADFAEFLKVLAERVEQGYRQAGMGCKVTGWFDGSVVVAEVKKRNAPKPFGGYVSAGDHVDEFVRRLASEQITRRWQYRLVGGRRIGTTTQPLFVVGEPPHADKLSIKQFSKHLAACLLDTGRVVDASSIDLKVVPSDDVQRQRVEIIGNEPRLRIGPIEINGLTRHTRDEVLELIGVAEGDPLRAAALERVCDRLAGCHRFWRHAVTVDAPKAPNRYGQGSTDAKLTLDLVEFEAVPRLGEPLGEVDQAVLRAAAWLGNLDEFDGDIVVDYRDADGYGGMVVSPSTGSCVIDIHGKHDLGAQHRLELDHSLLTVPGECAVADWRRGLKLDVKRPLKPVVNFALTKNTSHRQGAWSMGLSITSDANDPPLKLNVQPGALLHMADSSDAAYLRDGVLTLVSQTEDLAGTLRFEAATGRLIEATFDSLDNEQTMAMTTESGAFTRRAAEIRRACEPFANRFEAERPLHSAAAFALDQIGAQPAVREHPLGPSAVAVAWALLESDEGAAWVERFESKPDNETDGDRPRFKIPSVHDKEADDWRRNTVYYLPVVADRAFPRGSWPWTLTRETAFVHDAKARHAADEAKPVGREINRTLGLDGGGPLAALAIAKWLRWMRCNPGTAAWAARVGLRRLDEPRVLADLEPLLDPDHGCAGLVTEAISFASQRSPAELVALRSAAPEVLRTPLDKFAARRATNPDEPPTDAVRAAVLEAWRDGWRDEVRDELQVLAGE